MNAEPCLTGFSYAAPFKVCPLRFIYATNHRKSTALFLLQLVKNSFLCFWLWSLDTTLHCSLLHLFLHLVGGFFGWVGLSWVLIIGDLATFWQVLCYCLLPRAERNIVIKSSNWLISKARLKFCSLNFWFLSSIPNKLYCVLEKKI